MMDAVSTELDALADRGIRLEVWWRDDDAVADGPALDRLLALGDETGIAPALAVIPGRLEPSLPRRLARHADVAVLVHGWRHENHAGTGSKASEFGRDRPIHTMLAEAADGWRVVRSAFGLSALPIFVPPWNRIDGAVAAVLPDAGYAALSCFGEPDRISPIPRIDTHLDPVGWRGDRGLAPSWRMASMIREAVERGSRTMGLLTHHLVLDEDTWAFSRAFLLLADRHPALRPVRLPDLLARPHPAQALAKVEAA